MKLNEVDGKLPGKPLKHIGDRAGVYPLYRGNDGTIYVYMMVPSNPKFGGALPQMGKGGIDDGETPEQAAMREGHEELGLLAKNVKKISLLTTSTIRGKQDTYHMTVFVAEVFGKDDFDPHGYEAKWTGWVEIDEAIKVSRKNQQQFLHQVKAKYDNEQSLEEDVDDKDEKIRAYEAYADQLEAKLDDIKTQIEELNKDGVKNINKVNQLYKLRNTTQAQIAHANSQIDLILRLDVDPLRAPERDPSLSLGEWARSLAPVIKRIRQDCEPYLNAINYDVMEYKLYRGMRGTDAPYATGRVRLDDRKPMATGIDKHEAINKYFTEKYGEPFRNALFTSAKANFAADYGNLFLVFPTGDFTFVWSEEVEDLYNYEHVLDEALDDDRENPGGEFFKAAMDHYNYHNSDLQSAIESGMEIMIRTPVYYGINLSSYWQRDDLDDDSVGDMSEINQAMKIIQELLTDED